MRSGTVAVWIINQFIPVTHKRDIGKRLVGWLAVLVVLGLTAL